MFSRLRRSAAWRNEIARLECLVAELSDENRELRDALRRARNLMAVFLRQKDNHNVRPGV